MRKLGRFPIFFGLLGLAIALLFGYIDRTASALPKDSLIIAASDGCPTDKPLDCGNGWCCESGHTLHCPSSTCTDEFGVALNNACINPDLLTDEQLAHVRNCCPALATCR